MVGDIYQLPPISFGPDLHRLATISASTAEPRIADRQAEGTGIPEISRSIGEGVIPSLSPSRGRRTVCFLYPVAGTRSLASLSKWWIPLDGFRGG
jgi:hypothetical protein